MIRTVRVIVTGRVQGVGYRAWAEQEAETRRLFGWVRNRRDGSVEALFSGEAMAVDAMTKACRSGPRMAVVEKVIVVNTSADLDLRGFWTIRPIERFAVQRVYVSLGDGRYLFAKSARVVCFR
jgi:acylphosphatase